MTDPVAVIAAFFVFMVVVSITASMITIITAILRVVRFFMRLTWGVVVLPFRVIGYLFR